MVTLSDSSSLIPVLALLQHQWQARLGQALELQISSSSELYLLSAAPRVGD